MPARPYTPGSQADFERLYNDSYVRVYRTLLAILRDPAAAEDCAQETFVKAFGAWDRWTPEAPAEAWLHRIAVNVAASYRRRERLRDVGETIRRLGRPAPEPDPAQRGESHELFEALRALSADQAALIVLRHHHGYSNRELAATFGVPETTLGSRLAVARSRLQAELAKRGFVSPSASRVVRDEELERT